MKNREFIRKTYHEVTDTDIQDLKKGIVSVLIVHKIPLSMNALSKELYRIGQFQRQDVNYNFINTITLNKETQKLPWHMDRSYHFRPPRFIALYAFSTPEKEVGGETLYCDMQKACQDLPTETMKKLNDLQLLHFNKYALTPKYSKKIKKNFHILSAVHPLVQFDETGKYLFFSEDYVADFIYKEELCRHIYQPAYIYKHHWSSFDLVISNNFKTNHRREKMLNPGQSPRIVSRVHLFDGRIS